MPRQCCSRFERTARQQGWMRIAGLDEAGRGALFGPVVAAAVILNHKRRIVGLDDSKKLSPDRRAELAPRIREHAIAWAVAEIDAQRIDAWNIYQASRQAMTAALQQLPVTPDYLLLDAMQYGLAQHKGYATAGHLAALRQHGPSPLHRHSFAPVRDSRCWAANAQQAPLPL
jgi:ribonuclease HII